MVLSESVNDKCVCCSDEKYEIGNDYLMIRNIQLEDKGVYLCNLNIFAIGVAYTHRITVTVTGQCSQLTHRPVTSVC
jgi:hypothetical protein